MTAIERDQIDLERDMREIGLAARRASELLARAEPERKTAALQNAAAAIRASRGELLAANAEDVADAVRAGLSGAMLDRLQLD